MVAQQILRAAHLVAGLALTAAAGTAAAERPAILVDLRDSPEQGGGELAPALQALPELLLRDDVALMAALAGAPAPGSAAAGQVALAEAGEAYGQLDCERASGAAARATAHLAAARAADPQDQDLVPSLVRAHVYELLCADARGDHPAGQLAAQRLRNLGASEPPPGVAAELWERYPEIDATGDVRTVPLSVTTDPPGATVWIDHLPRGGSGEILVPEGPRLLAAAGPEGLAAAREVEVTGWPLPSVKLELTPVDDRWEALRGAIAAWRGGREPSPLEIANLLQRLEAEIVVVRHDGGVRLWASSARERVARRLGDFGDADAEEIARAVGKRVAAWQPRQTAGPEPGVPLLREEPDESDSRGGINEPAWWVYASILGAVGLGAALVIASDLADDRQRIELSWP